MRTIQKEPGRRVIVIRAPTRIRHKAKNAARKGGLAIGRIAGGLLLCLAGGHALVVAAGGCGLLGCGSPASISLASERKPDVADFPEIGEGDVSDKEEFSIDAEGMPTLPPIIPKEARRKAGKWRPKPKAGNLPSKWQTTAQRAAQLPANERRK